MKPGAAPRCRKAPQADAWGAFQRFRRRIAKVLEGRQNDAVSEGHAHAAAPDSAIVGEGGALLVEDVVDAEVGAEVVVDLLAHDEVQDAQGNVLIGRSPANDFFMPIARSPIVPQRRVPAVLPIVVAELQARLVVRTIFEAQPRPVVTRIEIGIEAAQGEAASERLPRFQLDALQRGAVEEERA